MSRRLTYLGLLIVLIFTTPQLLAFCEFDNDALDSDYDDGDIYNHRMNRTYSAQFGGIPASFDIYDANADGKLEFIVLSQDGLHIFTHEGVEITNLVEDYEFNQLNEATAEDQLSSAFGADLDGDKLPELYVTTWNGLYIWEYDKSSKSWGYLGLQEEILIDRFGACTTGTMFRTNLDDDKEDEYVIYDLASNILMLNYDGEKVVLSNIGRCENGLQDSTHGDIDNDGVEELLTWGIGQPLVVHRFDKTDKMYKPVFTSSMGVNYVACGDYDNNGDDEVYIIGSTKGSFDGEVTTGIGRILLDINHKSNTWTEEILHMDDHYQKSGAHYYDYHITAGDITNNKEAEIVTWMNQPNNGVMEILYVDEDPKTEYKMYYHVDYDRQNLNYGLYVCDSDGDGKKEVISLQRIWRASGSMLGGGSIDIAGVTNIVVTEWTDPASRMGIFGGLGSVSGYIRIGLIAGVVIAIITIASVAWYQRNN